VASFENRQRKIHDTQKEGTHTVHPSRNGSKIRRDEALGLSCRPKTAEKKGQKRGGEMWPKVVFQKRVSQKNFVACKPHCEWRS